MKLPFINIKKSKPQFAVRTITKGRQKIQLPMVKEGKLSSWRPIVKVYDTYLVMDYEHPKGLTQEQCLQHIQGYYKQLQAQEEASVVTIETTIVNEFSVPA